MKELQYMSVAEEAMRKIKKGAFLTVKSTAGLNTMTIGWAMFGFIWQKPVLMVAVRPTRHTFGIIERAADFAVTVPSQDMLRETSYCGTKSGRDVDKFRECGLKTAQGRRAGSPVIDVPGIHFECKIVFRSAMDPARLSADYNSALYPLKDYHTLYFGEILACYETE